MPLALGRHLLFREITHGGALVAVIALVAVVLLVRFWPQITAWIEERMRR
ncbi:MAG: hypothetical protein U0R52_04440 [Solirubrobacterales bacterium]